jgi:hemin uptake protein HemP
VKAPETPAACEAGKEERRMADGIPTRTAQELLGAGRILRIEHEGETYTLRITRNNRLILTK